MKKYSTEWKKDKGSWVQRHRNEKWGYYYKIHYIEFETEYSKGEFTTRIEAEKELQKEKI